jgi:hypothetical protein
MRSWGLLTQDIATVKWSSNMADKQPAAPTHRAYSVIKREGQDDFWLNIGLAFPHKDGDGCNIILQAFPLDGKIVCRKVDDEESDKPALSSPEQNSGGRDRQTRRR